MEIFISLFFVVVGAIGIIFGRLLYWEARRQQRKPKDNRTYGKGVSRHDRF